MPHKYADAVEALLSEADRIFSLAASKDAENHPGDFYRSALSRNDAFIMAANFLERAGLNESGRSESKPSAPIQQPLPLKESR
jgi:hypothetical protein